MMGMRPGQLVMAKTLKEITLSKQALFGETSQVAVVKTLKELTLSK